MHKLLFSFDGRVSRLTYWVHLAAFLGVVGTLSLIADHIDDARLQTGRAALFHDALDIGILISVAALVLLAIWSRLAIKVK